MKHEGKIRLLIFFISGLIILDRFTKWFVLNRPDFYQSNLIKLELFRNPNLYFIPLQGSFGAGFLYFLIGAVILLLCFLFLRSWQKRDFLLMTGFSLIIFGGLSNFLDRIIFGYVIDWIRVFFLPISIFNIADIMIIAGILCIMIKVFVCKLHNL